MQILKQRILPHNPYSYWNKVKFPKILKKYFYAIKLRRARSTIKNQIKNNKFSTADAIKALQFLVKQIQLLIEREYLNTTSIRHLQTYIKNIRSDIKALQKSTKKKSVKKSTKKSTKKKSVKKSTK